ncbi:MAG: 4-hydroxy-tetrahydrodipicolinate reductase [Acidobacteriales bacterium]|nr:4-hydroxy-tetrahydrodipicolinate reductase [Candidatus Koribacter versatilis]MBI3645478.1 4-hydroxy-tetrahydrodipicolinate reductase [Terriglobales bacterium]
MNLLILGRGKTGSLVAEVARARRHHVRVLGASENANAHALTADFLSESNAVIDFTIPSAVVANAEACIRAGKNMVVGTTGWYDHVPQLRDMVQSAKTGFLYGSNFSIGMNLFFEIVKASAPALGFEYSGQIFERHHAQKKDAPSGTAITLRKILRESGGQELGIVSFREGDVVGMHEVVFNSANDRIYLCHDSKSRRGFAEGAVRAAEWLAGKQGFFEFREVWKQL